MANYTDEEIQTAVEQLVQSTISRPYDTLGTRRTDISFSEIQQAAAGVFLLYPKAPFYCLFLGAKKLLESLTSEAVTISALLESIGSSGRYVVPIEDVTPLFNAKAALDALGQAAIQRSTSFKDITAVPAYQRFATNVDRFLETGGQSIREGGSIVETPQAAKQGLPGLVATLKAQHEAVITAVGYLAKGVDDYTGLNLSALVAQSVISKSATLVGDHADELNALLPEERLTKIRQVVLDLLAAKSVVTSFGSFGGAPASYTVQGTGTPYSDATHLAEAAETLATYAGPYFIVPGANTLDFYLQGSVSISASVILPYSFAAQITGQYNEIIYASGDGWIIGNGTNPLSPSGATIPLNNSVRFDISGVLHTVPLTVSADATRATALGTVDLTTLTYGGGGTLNTKMFIVLVNTVSYTVTFVAPANPAAVVTAINAIVGVGFASLSGNFLKLTIQDNTLGTASNLKIGAGTSNANLGFTLNAITYGTDPVPRTAAQICTDINAVMNAFGWECVPILSPRKFFGQVDIAIVAGPQATFTLLGGFGNFGALGITVDMIINTPGGTQPGLWNIDVVTPTVLTATRIDLASALNELSATIEVGPAQRRIRFQSLVPLTTLTNYDYISTVDDGGVNRNGANTIGFIPTAVYSSRPSTAKDIALAINNATSLVKGSARHVPVLVGASARGSVSEPFKLVLSKLQTNQNTTWTGPLVTFPLPSTTGLVVGDLVVERSGNNIGTTYAITVVGVSSITATFVSGVGSTQSFVELEIGASAVLSKYHMFRVLTGPNQGDYYVSGGVGLDYSLVNALSLPTDPLTGKEAVFTVDYGPEALVSASVDRTTLSKIKVRGNAISQFHSVVSAGYIGQAGRTRYFRLPKKVNALSVDDLLLLYATQYNIPSATIVITAIADNLLTLSQTIESDVSWLMTPTATVPFAKLRSGHTFDYDAFKVSLESWLAGTPQQEAFFTDLNRFINPLISNVNPTSVAINDASNKVKALAKELTLAFAAAYGGSIPLEDTLDNLVVGHQPTVDALIRSFREKGCDRAVDLLLGGQFQVFFALDHDDSSYAGNMQKAMRDVVHNDLPMGKIARKDARRSRLLSTTEDIDPEYNLDDAEQAVADPAGVGDF